MAEGLALLTSDRKRTGLCLSLSIAENATLAALPRLDPRFGDLFAVDLKPHNRWMGFKALRARWLAHLDASLMRPVLLIDDN